MQKDQQKLIELIKGKKVAFIGAGVSHKTLIKEFVELGAHVTLCDQKKSVEEFGDYAATIRELGIDLSLGEHYLDGFKGQDIIMRTPGFVGYFEKPLQDAMAAGTMVTSEVELFFDFCPCEIVAVTGSDGKTTTTTLISKLYEAAGRKVHLGGNIGAALLPMLPEVAPDDVEIGTIIVIKPGERIPLDGVVVEGFDNTPIKFAKCCSPLPGDPIVGFITRGFGVSIHKQTCANAVASMKDPSNAPRWVKAYWADSVKDSYKAGLEIIALNRNELLQDVLSALADIRVPIYAMNARQVENNCAVVSLTIGINNTEHLNRVVARLSKVRDVLKVTRS